MDRQAAILDKLMKEEHCTIRELSLLCDVSYKTIQNDLHELNRLLPQYGHKGGILLERGKGVRLSPSAREAAAKLFRQLNSSERQTDFDNDYFVKWIAIDLLQKKYLKIDDICDELSASRSTISRLWQRARAELNDVGITVSSRPHYGLTWQAPESTVREFIFSQLADENEDRRSLLLQASPEDVFPLKERIIALVHDFDLEMGDDILDQLMLYIRIQVARLRKGHSIESLDISCRADSFEYILSEKIASQMESFAKGMPGPEEIKWIYRFVLGKCRKHTETSTGTDTAPVEEIIYEALALINERYGYDFSGDIELFSSLEIHLRALLERAAVSNYAVNPLLDEIKAYSLQAYDMAVDFYLLIRNKLGIILPEDEVSFFSIYLHLALERQKQRKIVPVRALVVCPAGHGMSELVTRFLKRQYGEYISVAKTCSYYELPGMDFSRYDYIFTIVPLQMEVPLPVVEFNLNENQVNASQLRLDLKKSRGSRTPLLMFTSEDLFFKDIKATNKLDVLTQMIEKIKKKIDLAPDFLDSVIRREDAVPTELEYGYAFPHPLDKNLASQPFLAVAVLPSSIRWKRRKVRIILLSYVTGSAQELEPFFDSVVALVSNREYAIRLEENPTFKTLVRIAEDIYRENIE